MTDTPLYEAMREFIRAQVALEVTKTTTAEVRGVRAEIESLRLEQRAAPVLATQPPIDENAIATRAAALVPPIDHEAIAKRAAELVPPPKNGEDGKDAVVNTEEIIARVAEVSIPRIAALIPTPKNGEPGAPGKDGERGEDGIASREEIEALIDKRFAEVQTRTLADAWRGVWKHGELSARGSVAQWDGCAWLALNDTRAEPGHSPDWALFAKKGRDTSKNDFRR